MGLHPSSIGREDLAASAAAAPSDCEGLSEVASEELEVTSSFQSPGKFPRRMNARASLLPELSAVDSAAADAK